MSNLLKNLMFALGLAVIVWLGYMLIKSNGDEEALVSGGGGESAASIQAREYRRQIDQLEALDLSGGVLKDARFESLVDHSQDLGEEEAGRDNPFAPVE